MKLSGWRTPRRSARKALESRRNGARFSRACGAVVPLRANGLPSPNSAAAERVRAFLVQRLPGSVSIGDIASSQGREASRFYREHEGANSLSWDWVDRAGAELTLEDRLILGRFLMDRWGLRVDVGQLPEMGA